MKATLVLYTRMLLYRDISTAHTSPVTPNPNTKRDHEKHPQPKIFTAQMLITLTNDFYNSFPDKK